MRPEGDCLCGRNWAEEPIQGNSDLWVITCNVLRRRAVSGCLFDSISCTQSSATHSLRLNCPICFHHDAQLFLQPFPLSAATKRKHTHTHTQSASVLHTNKSVHPASTTQFPFPACPARPPPTPSTLHTHTQTGTHRNLHVNSPTVGLYILFNNILCCH